MNGRAESDDTERSTALGHVSSSLLLGCVVVVCLTVGTVGGVSPATSPTAESDAQLAAVSGPQPSDAGAQLSPQEIVSVRIDDLSSAADGSSRFITSYAVSNVDDFDRVEVEYSTSNDRSEEYVETIGLARGSSQHRIEGGFGESFEITLRVYDDTDSVVAERTIPATADGSNPVAEELATGLSPTFDSATFNNLSVSQIGYAQYELSYGVNATETYGETGAFLVGLANGTGTDEQRSADEAGTLTLNAEYDGERAFKLTALVFNRDGVVVDSRTEWVGTAGPATPTDAATDGSESGRSDDLEQPTTDGESRPSVESGRTGSEGPSLTATTIGGVGLIASLGGLLWLVRRNQGPTDTLEGPSDTDAESPEPSVESGETDVESTGGTAESPGTDVDQTDVDQRETTDESSDTEPSETTDEPSDTDAEPSETTEESPDAGTESGQTADDRSDTDAESNDEPTGGSLPDSTDSSHSEPTASGPSEPSTPPEHLLSNEERILRFVRDNGGRVKQQQVVSEFDWSAARTSQLVTQLREDDEIEVFRLGRENVLKLPDEDA